MSGSANTRIGYLTSQYPAASHTFIRREVAALRARGVEIVTYSVRPGDGGAAALDRDAAESTFAVLRQSASSFLSSHAEAAIRHPLRYLRTLAFALKHRVPGARALLWAAFHFAEAIVLARRLPLDRIGHLHNHFANSGATVGLLASRFAGVSWSLTLHGISEFDYPAGVLLADKIAGARFVACVSKFGMAQAMRITEPDQWAKLHLVRCGIDLAMLPPRSAGIEGRAPHILCVGRLSSEKGHAGLIGAFAHIHRTRPEVQLTLVGDGPEGSRLRAQVAAAGLENVVRFAGRLDEKATLCAIADADLLVLPSFMEGLPVVLMEAMALGVPVIASRVAGIPELVRHGETGLLFDPADWAQLEGAIVQLVDDLALGERLSRAARTAIEAEFAIDRAVAPLAALLMPGSVTA